MDELTCCPKCRGKVRKAGDEDSGYGELFVYWECLRCGATGKVVIDQQNGNAVVDVTCD